MSRDYNGERGAVPTDYRAHDWRTCRVMRELGDEWLARIRRPGSPIGEDSLLARLRRAYR
jgi:hypothetical protein